MTAPVAIAPPGTPEHPLEAGAAPLAAARRAVGDFIELTKPRVVTMVLVTTLVGFYLGSGTPDWWLLAATLLFIVWLARLSGGDEQVYDIFFRTGVDGLSKGSAVTFSGVPSGQVTEIALMPDQPEFVRVRISVNAGTPILQGTTATIAGVGFTGVSQINLDGAVRGQPPIMCPEQNARAACPFFARG